MSARLDEIGQSVAEDSAVGVPSTGSARQRGGSRRVLQLGVGAVGEVNARVAGREPAVEAVVLADIDESRLREVATKLPPGKAEMLILDASVDGYELACWFNVETMIEECLLPPCVFRDGREERNEALSVHREFDFPAPAGGLTLCNVDHEEAQLTPIFLRGVFPAEVLDPGASMAEMEEVGLAVGVVDLPVA